MEHPGNIYQYNCYRQYLKDYVASKKMQQSGFSYSVWAKSLNLKSSSTLIMIINGQRHPSSTLVQRISKYFNFNDHQTIFFKDLIQLEKEKSNPHMQTMILEKLAKSKAYEGSKLLTASQFRSISSPLHYTLREMIQWEDFKWDPLWIQSKLITPASEQKILEAIQDLLASGLIRVSSSGELQATDQHITTESDKKEVALREFHMEALSQAQSALEKVETSQRHTSGVTFSIKKENYMKAKKMISNFERELVGLIEDPQNGEAIYHLSVSLTPKAIQND